MDDSKPPARGIQTLLQQSAVTKQQVRAAVNTYVISSGASDPVHEFLHPRMEMTVYASPVQNDVDEQQSMAENSTTNSLRYVNTRLLTE